MDPTQVIELAKQIEETDPIDWSDLPLNRESIYFVLGTTVLERVAKTQSASEREIILLASVVKLTVENFVLEMRLRKNNTWHVFNHIIKGKKCHHIQTHGQAADNFIKVLENLQKNILRKLTQTILHIVSARKIKVKLCLMQVGVKQNVKKAECFKIILDN
jgi:hypothetical protein